MRVKSKVFNTNQIKRIFYLYRISDQTSQDFRFDYFIIAIATFFNIHVTGKGRLRHMRTHDFLPIFIANTHVISIKFHT